MGWTGDEKHDTEGRERNEAYEHVCGHVPAESKQGTTSCAPEVDQTAHISSDLTGRRYASRNYLLGAAPDPSNVVSLTADENQDARDQRQHRHQSSFGRAQVQVYLRTTTAN